MTDEDILIILWDIMAGGIDTTATTMEWLIYILVGVGGWVGRSSQMIVV
jgi:cytochrome P450